MSKRETPVPQERYSGPEHETDLFGSMPNYRSPEFAEKLAKISEPNGYAPRDKMIRLFIDHPEIQPGASIKDAQGQSEHSPENPKSEFLNDLRIGVLDALGADPDDPAALRVEMFNALKSPLDAFHGIDGFLVVHDKEKDVVITMDASLNQDKLATGYKADIIIGDVPSAVFEGDKYLARIEELSAELVKILHADSQPSPNIYRGVA